MRPGRLSPRLPTARLCITGTAQNYISIVKYLGDINFTDYFTNNNLNDCLQVFHGHINYIIDNFIPKMQKYNFKFPIWFSKELRCLIKQKI
ncbi:Reverse transcriptase domain-containing protein [Aphis craccivora]|uniref:Reverse transcriptase domain-containing protein n=1 Tax=Aphis craccivora TaxID=307492 RepID=A0A6G0Y4T2_APHCR|nr:Reverse transcriptase domain-containing protein [Aphis craccivora]